MILEVRLRCLFFVSSTNSGDWSVRRALGEFEKHTQGGRGEKKYTSLNDANELWSGGTECASVLLTQRRYAFSISTHDCICFGLSARARSNGPRPFSCNSPQSTFSRQHAHAFRHSDLHASKVTMPTWAQIDPMAGQTMPSIRVCIRLPFCGFPCRLFNLLFNRLVFIAKTKYWDYSAAWGDSASKAFSCFCVPALSECLDSSRKKKPKQKQRIYVTLFGFLFPQRCRILEADSAPFP